MNCRLSFCKKHFAAQPSILLGVSLAVCTVLLSQKGNASTVGLKATKPPTDAHRRQAVCNPKMRNCRRIDPENAESQCEAIAESANAPYL
jgi:hypothetical protein